MNREINDIKVDNSLNNITNEYHSYNEYNFNKTQDNNYKETTSFKEVNDNRSITKSKTKSASFVTKLAILATKILKK